MAQYRSLYSERHPLDRGDQRDTVIDLEPQIGLYERPMARLANIKTSRRSVESAGGPPLSTEITPSSDNTSQRSSLWSKPPSLDSDDELYNLTDDDSVEVPLICSDSVKKRAVRTTKARYPSLVIPSPSHWPMPPSACKPSACSIGISPVSKIALSPARLAAFNARQHHRIPSRTSTPSLDGSMTSEELAACSDSCPSTPDRQVNSPRPGEWEPPTQLGADAIALLNSLTPYAGGGGSDTEDIEVPEDAINEMRQIIRDPPIRHQLVPGSELAASHFVPGSEPVSALSVPSPGGFFASLHVSARQTWCGSTPPPPSTSTAEQFYGVPWRSNSPSRNHGLRLDTQRATTPPAFPRKDSLFSPTDCAGIEATEITESAFQVASQSQSEPQVDRTKRWLFSQLSYLTAVASDDPKTPEDKLRSCFSPDTPSTGRTNPFEDSPSKKSVRFLESVPESEEASFTHRSAEIEPLFFQGFKSVSSRFRGMDAFLHSQMRAEASHVSSSSLPQKHISQLSGSFVLESPDRPQPARPISALVPTASDVDEHSKTIARAERERQALEQIVPSVWSLDAARHIFGSTLITSPAVAHLRSGADRRILDFGGAPSCDWGWAVALQFRHCTVITVPSSPTSTTAEILTGPPNHSVVPAARFTALPFEDNTFDLISARSLHALLRTTCPDPSRPEHDEYDAVIAEFLRVLRPGGYLEFNLLDAELLHPGPLGQALSVEFAFVLRQRGYDPQASRYFLPRLRKAGFADVKRAWLVLPAADVVPRWVDRGKMHTRKDSGVASSEERVEIRETMRFFEVGDGEGNKFEKPVVGTTGDVRAMTGLVGVREWERWVLKVQREAAGDEGRMLERVNRAVEEVGKVKGGWRCLMGWARKAE
ncbi:DnaJ subfamily C member 3 [Sphaceloma murrayae]|uniref:DnaJ subfamily C member 3 n=1 Tax=Sphaceloma murrayae TaxID=2082308 RepID=A0A2K1QUI9_9PEZI|nr:DnaJ subfamily C member 3 [Sphaceloma murrayae]